MVNAPLPRASAPLNQRTGGVLLLCAVLVSGCSDGAFEVAGAPDGAVADTGSDASSEVADAALDDGEAPAPVAFCQRQPAPVALCDDFETQAFAKGWTTTFSDNGTIAVASGVGRAGSPGARVQKTVDGAGHIGLSRSGPPLATSLRETFDLRITSATMVVENSAFVTLATLPGFAAVGIAVRPQPGSNTFNVELWVFDGSRVPIGFVAPNTFTRITLGLGCTSGTCEASARLDDGATRTAPLVAQATSTANWSMVGLNIGTGGRSYDLVLDDVVLDWTTTP